MRVRTAEVAGALSLATDLGMRAEFEHGLRATRYAMRLGEILGADAATMQASYYVSLLLYVGCTADLDLLSDAFGDEEDFRVRVAPIAYGPPGPMMRAMLPMAGRPATGARRIVATARTLVRLPREMPRMMRTHCEVSRLHVGQLGLPDKVRDVVGAAYERWDGKGGPSRLRGDEIPLAVRIAHVAHDLDQQRSVHGTDADDVLRERAGRAFDPSIVAAALSLDTLDGAESSWHATLAAEPEPVLFTEDAALDRSLTCFGAFAELIAPFLRGHSTVVADLAARAAAAIGLDDAEVALVRRAGLVHDVGRVTVPVRVWERAGPLGPDDWERVRLHAYHGGRVLAKSAQLAGIGVIASAHHERCDGSGYHRGTGAAELPRTARVLAVADAYAAMRADRPHRPALAATRAADELRSEVRHGRLDQTAVDAVLAVAGHGRAPGAMPDLTARETEVLRLVARGAANKQIARTLGISAKTVDNHVQHIYAKAAVSTRAAATLWAIQRGLLS